MRKRELPRDSFLTSADAQEVIDVLAPSINAALAAWGKRQHLAIVIHDPTDPNSMLLEHGIGNPADWEHDYMKIAHAKAALCARHGCDSADVIDVTPFLLQEGDVVFPGGINRSGLVVACSGVQGYYDVMFAEWIAAALLAVARDGMDFVKQSGISFIGEGTEAHG
jgi:hypothetical protein